MSLRKPISPSFRHRFRFIGLRGKLLLATLTIFILPVAGFSYLKELEVFLKNNHAQSVEAITSTIATVFKDNGTLINLNKITQSHQPVIYCHSLKDKMVIDGYSDDWFSLQNARHSFPSSMTPQNDKFSVICANDEQFYYFLVNIHESRTPRQKSFGVVTYAKKPIFNTIYFQYLDYAHDIRDYHFQLTTPGWVNGNLSNPLASGSKRHIRGEWQENAQGYNLEFKVPIALINRHIAFKLDQHDGAESKTLSSTIPTETLQARNQLNPLISNDPLSNLRLQQLVPANSQLWLVNKHNYVYARASTLKSENQKQEKFFSLLSFVRRLYLLLMDYPEQLPRYGDHQASITNNSITEALNNQGSSSWLDNPYTEQLTLFVTTPVLDHDNKVIGALVLEQANDSVLALQDKTFERILLVTIILFFGMALSLLFFSTSLLNRIINLRNDTERALSHDGLITNQLYRNDNDEIGDLARSFSGLLTQVDQNNQYLKSLASKLSHELRTPLTIIKSSLENMSEMSMSDDNLKSSLRAKDGCKRLNDLLNRMSEANRLEQMINTMDKETLDIVDFLHNYLDAIQSANTDIKFIFESSLNYQLMTISPELLAQLFDKLISNAISFHSTGTPIKLLLTKQKQHLVLELNNVGPLIDDKQLTSIFNSLTSFRHAKGQEVHLGLGLYIAALISKFHEGELHARNYKEKQSVSFILLLPVAKQSGKPNPD